MTNNSSPKRAPRGAANGGAEKPLKEKSSPGPAVNLVASGALPTWVPERDPLLEAKKKIDEQAVIQRVNRHLIPIFFVMTVLCYIDRTNLAYAALQINKHLGLTEYAYGLGASIFFLGYSLFQVPSNLLLVKLGGSCWLSVIVVSWGIVATLFACMKSVQQFYVLRFLLGLTESGTFPGMWYHMSLFLSDKEIGMAYSYVVAGTTLSQVVASPMAAGLLALDGVLGLAGWQWLFIVEGLPTILLGLYINAMLAESPQKAAFLSPEEREWLHQRQQRVKATKPTSGASLEGGWAAARDWRTWYLGTVCLLEAVIKNAIMYYCPLIIASLVGRYSAGTNAAASRSLLSAGAAVVQPGSKGEEHGIAAALLTALPFGTAASSMLLCAKHSQATGERRYHMVVPLLIGSGALLVLSKTLDTAPITAFVALVVATLIWGPAGIIYGLPATFLHGPAAATGIALINSVANVGGMIGPCLMGWMKHRHGSFSKVIVVFASLALVTALLLSRFPLDAPAPVLVRTMSKPAPPGVPEGWQDPKRKDNK